MTAPHRLVRTVFALSLSLVAPLFAAAQASPSITVSTTALNFAQPR